jgi:hypothetical protein
MGRASRLHNRQEQLRRAATIALSVLLAASAAVPAALAQSTRAEELPNNNPSATWAYPNQVYFRSYVGTRPVPSVAFDGTVAIGAQVPSSVIVYGIEGEPYYRSFRYGRVNDRYIVIDQSGRIVDVID